jgi:hypothetical protein
MNSTALSLWDVGIVIVLDAAAAQMLKLSDASVRIEDLICAMNLCRCVHVVRLVGMS